MSEFVGSEFQCRVREMFEDVPKLATPEHPVDVAMFLGSEMGELFSALMQARYGHAMYPRTNPERHTDVLRNLILEVGQVQMMLAALATSLNLDLSICLDIAIDRMHTVHGG